MTRSFFIPIVPILISAWLPAFSQPVCPVWNDPHTVFDTIGPGADLASTVRQAASGTTILLRSGTYRVSSTVLFTTDDVTLRSLSGNRDSVIIDGNTGGMPLQASNFVLEIIQVAASNVTIADLTIRYAGDHGIHAYAPADRGITNLHMRNLHVYDCSEQQIKVNSNGSTPLYWVDDGLLECSLVEFPDNALMELQPGEFYTGGIDVHGGWNWIVRDNVFRNFQRNDTLLEAAVHFWDKSRGTLVEQNLFVDNYRAITFGMNTAPSTTDREYPDSAGDNPYLDEIDGIIRNNMIFNHKGTHLESGMELTNVAQVEVYNNTVFAGDNPFSGIEYRWPNTRVILANNISSYNILQRDSGQAVLETNLANAPATLFVDAVNGDLHLLPTATSAINQGTKLAAGKADYDYDGRLRDAHPDIGADEYGASSPVLPLPRRPLPAGWRILLGPGPTLISPEGLPYSLLGRFKP